MRQHNLLSRKVTNEGESEQSDSVHYIFTVTKIKPSQIIKRLNSPHSIFVHWHCHLLQLACVQAANNTQGIKHVY